ncbi:uncharacterized protein PRCAT00002165001 [Priceomyces carsonii]|uniref:uncharacterized protein n=1 Tax=Priceomyces carsonii TaxID=28549 RepID=UPI002ED7EC7F|nr:unnamed protein product [Priceomyces carsonii]
MKLYSIVCICSFIATLVGAFPGAMPIEDTSFQLSAFLEDSLDGMLPMEEVLEFYDMLNIQKRDGNEKVIASVLNAVNRSGIVWDVLDEVSSDDERIQVLANLTANLINSTGSSISLSTIQSLTKGTNTSSIIKIVRDSGLVTSLLDGILLDKSYRPTIERLIKRVVLDNKFTILVILNSVLSPSSSNQKRDTKESGLELLVTNIAAKLLSSSLFENVLNDTVVALNDTGFLVYTVKRFIATDEYLNMTVKLTKDIYNSGKVNIDLSSLNITKLVDDSLSDPKKIASYVGDILSGDFNFGSYLGKYTTAVREIIKDLESDGMFQELNDYLFPSSSSSSKATSTRANKNVKISELTVSSSVSSPTVETATDSSADFIQPNTFIFKCLLALQTFFIGGAFLI